MPGVVITVVDKPTNISSTPAPATPPVGAISTYVNNGIYYQIDSAGKSQRLDSVNVGSTAPENPSAGLFWLDTSSDPNKMKTYQNSDWREVFLYNNSLNQVAYDGGSF